MRDAAERGVGRCASTHRLRASARAVAHASDAARTALRRAARLVPLGALALAGCLNVPLPFGGLGPLQEQVVYGSKGPKILMVDLDGVLSEEAEQGTLGLSERESMVARVREELELARKDGDVRAVLLRIQSPGGSVTASDVLYHEVLRFKEETKRPVYAHCMGVCASGGYYVAMAADRVLAHPTTVTGSIGVISQGLSVAGLMEKLGLENQTLTSGPFKDAGSPLRHMTPEERAQLQSVIDDMYGRFLEVVRAGRPQLDAEQVKKLADGRIYTARQALAAGLIDEIAYLPDTVKELEKRTGLERSRVVVYRRPRETRENLYSVSTGPGPRAEAPSILAAPAFLYLWAPGL